MSAVIMDGKALAAVTKEGIVRRVAELKRSGKEPMLAVVLVGENPASLVYVSRKERACAEVGIRSVVIRLPESVAQQEILDRIAEMNGNSAICGVMVQLPLPGHIDAVRVMDAISPLKDVDGAHVVNAGGLLTGKEGFVPCTPKGIIKLIDSTGVEIEGKNAVIIGRSNIVGKPCALLLMRHNATVTVCHSKTRDLADRTRDADILVAATGRAHMITGDMIKPGAVVVDVGITRTGGKLQGDVDFESARSAAGYITPVPGGVGPMTIAMLLENTVEASVRYA